MKHILLILFGCLISNFTFGQILKIQTGVSVSSLHARSERQGNVLTKQYDPLIGHSLFVGLDYLIKKHYSLSSNIGFVRKGSKEEYQHADETGKLVDATRKETLNYLSMNTVLDLKYPIRENITPYVSVGPRVDFLLDDDYGSEFLISDGFRKSDFLNSYNYGLLLGGGVTYNFSKFNIGLRGDYYLNAKDVVNSPERATSSGYYSSYDVKDKTFTVNMVFGVKL
ncbi:outer membrane beta-barrel protein [Pontibacter pudoricolor]|uniref:outer membrane beta-barrel protein n=1 Tax=Pontibacter pudoricolor TaxID=2694930 RepID=UPI001391E37E|nr:outer membrane beta-barrel protein [Pontibacter pudoricolor]